MRKVIVGNGEKWIDFRGILGGKVVKVFIFFWVYSGVFRRE